MSNLEWFKYCWVWDKKKGTGHLVAKIRPLQQTEDVVIFGEKRINYYPIMTKRDRPIKGREGRRTEIMGGSGYGTKIKTYTHAYPKTILNYPWYTNGKTFHPTQKPVALLEYLIRTYTNEGDTVLDNTMGSGTTMVACVNTGRNGTGIELYPLPNKPIHKTNNPDYFGIAQNRVEKAQNEAIQLALI